jgi:hypothetical protein
MVGAPAARSGATTIIRASREPPTLVLRDEVGRPCPGSRDRESVNVQPRHRNAHPARRGRRLIRPPLAHQSTLRNASQRRVRERAGTAPHVDRTSRLELPRGAFESSPPVVEGDVIPLSVRVAKQAVWRLDCPLRTTATGDGVAGVADTGAGAGAADIVVPCWAVLGAWVIDFAASPAASLITVAVATRSRGDDKRFSNATRPTSPITASVDRRASPELPFMRRRRRRLRVALRASQRQCRHTVVPGRSSWGQGLIGSCIACDTSISSSSYQESGRVHALCRNALAFRQARPWGNRSFWL